MSDAELVRQAIAGRPGACAELARRWAGRVAALCQARVRRVDVADAVARQTLDRGLRDLPTLPEPEHFGRRLGGIARNLCLAWLQKQRPDVNGDLSAAPPPEDDLLAGVEGLPEPCREVLLLRYVADASYQEIAEVLDVTPATVRTRLARARALLRESRPAGRVR